MPWPGGGWGHSREPAWERLCPAHGPGSEWTQGPPRRCPLPTTQTGGPLPALASFQMPEGHPEQPQELKGPARGGVALPAHFPHRRPSCRPRRVLHGQAPLPGLIMAKVTCWRVTGWALCGRPHPGLLCDPIHPFVLPTKGGLGSDLTDPMGTTPRGSALMSQLTMRAAGLGTTAGTSAPELWSARGSTGSATTWGHWPPRGGEPEADRGPGARQVSS